MVPLLSIEKNSLTLAVPMVATAVKVATLFFRLMTTFQLLPISVTRENTRLKLVQTVAVVNAVAEKVRTL